jgi:hypothetical protein
MLYLSYMSDKSCVDCGEDRVAVLHHDHVRGEKVAGVLALINQGHPWEKVQEEIAKCEIRCANCHMIATSKRGNWWTANL